MTPDEAREIAIRKLRKTAEHIGWGARHGETHPGPMELARWESEINEAAAVLEALANVEEKKAALDHIEGVAHEIAHESTQEFGPSYEGLQDWKRRLLMCVADLRGESASKKEDAGT